VGATDDRVAIVRIAYSTELLGRPLPDGPWALSAMF